MSDTNLQPNQSVHIKIYSNLLLLQNDIKDAYRKGQMLVWIN